MILYESEKFRVEVAEDGTEWWTIHLGCSLMEAQALYYQFKKDYKEKRKDSNFIFCKELDELHDEAVDDIGIHYFPDEIPSHKKWQKRFRKHEGSCSVCLEKLATQIMDKYEPVFQRLSKT